MACLNLSQTEFCGWGVEAGECLNQGDFIIEYIGEGTFFTWYFKIHQHNPKFPLLSNKHVLGNFSLVKMFTILHPLSFFILYAFRYPYGINHCIMLSLQFTLALYPELPFLEPKLSQGMGPGSHVGFTIQYPASSPLSHENTLVQASKVSICNACLSAVFFPSFCPVYLVIRVLQHVFFFHV